MTRRPSTIDKLPKVVRELIGRLRDDGHSIDHIRDKLLELDADVSRSALGRHVKNLAEVGERMRRSRAMAEALTARFGDQPDNQVARLNFELMHGIVFETLTAAPGSDEGHEGEEGGEAEGQALTLDPQQVKYLSGALKDLASAQSIDASRLMKIEEAALRKAASRVDKIARAAGWSAETAATVRSEILGIKLEPSAAAPASEGT